MVSKSRLYVKWESSDDNQSQIEFLENRRIKETMKK